MGRRPRKKFDEFRARIWFLIISEAIGSESPRYLERLFQPAHLKRNEDGKLLDSRSWDKYKKGLRLPKDGMSLRHEAHAVKSAEALVPDSAYVFRHPLWRFLGSEGFSYSQVVSVVFEFPAYVRRFYFDLALPGREEQKFSFRTNIGQPISIGRYDNFTDAFDHLCAQLMILRIQDFRHQVESLSGISENLAMILRHLSEAPWMQRVCEGFYDALQDACWGDLFDTYYDPEMKSRYGWRKAFPNPV